MESRPTTLTNAELQDALDKAVRHPHKHVHGGKLIMSPEIYTTSGCETNILISRFALIDCTG